MLLLHDELKLEVQRDLADNWELHRLCFSYLDGPKVDEPWEYRLVVPGDYREGVNRDHEVLALSVNSKGIVVVFVLLRLEMYEDILVHSRSEIPFLFHFNREDLCAWWENMNSMSTRARINEPDLLHVNLTEDVPLEPNSRGLDCYLPVCADCIIFIFIRGQ